MKITGLLKGTNGDNSIRVLALEVSVILGLAYEVHSDGGYAAWHLLMTRVGLLLPHANVEISFIR